MESKKQNHKPVCSYIVLLFKTRLEDLVTILCYLTVIISIIPLKPGETKAETVTLKNQKIYNLIETTQRQI